MIEDEDEKTFPDGKRDRRFGFIKGSESGNFPDWVILELSHAGPQGLPELNLAT